MSIGSAVDNAAETSGDLNKEAWDKYNDLRTALLTQHDTAGAHKTTSDVVLKALFDANTILAASTDDTPAALTVAASRIVGRASTGGIAALTASQVNNILGTATKSLDNLASVAINVSLISDTDDTDDLGSASKQWKNLYIDGTANIDSLIADTADINGGTIGSITFDGALTMSLGSDVDGDVYYRASNVLTRLAKGTATQVLTMNAGATAPEWAAGGAGTVDTSGTPVDDDFAKFTDADTIEGRSYSETLSDLGLDTGWVPAGENWTYASADDPTFIFTIAAFDATSKYSTGMRLKLTQTTVKYFIITKVVFDDPGSTITIYGGTDYDLVDAAITSPYYSIQKAPLDFPLDPIKWTVEVTDSTDRYQVDPVINTWYNPGSITIVIPIGSWRVEYFAGGFGETTGTWSCCQATLSTANNSETDDEFSSFMQIRSLGGYLVVSKAKFLLLASKTTYYFNARTVHADQTYVGFQNAKGAMLLRAICAYL